MKIFSEDYTSIKRELEFIKDSFGTTNFNKIADNIEMLESFYQMYLEISGVKDSEAYDMLLKNSKYRAAKDELKKAMKKKNITNFINYKDFHRSFSSKMLEANNRNYNSYIDKSLYLREEQMMEIICDFLDTEFKQADIFKDLVEDKCLFKSKIKDDNDDEKNNNKNTTPVAYTMFDYITRNNFIVVLDHPAIKDVDMMRIIVHEFGHVMDNINKAFASRKDISSYYFLSSYPEVYSLMNEKLFLDYLIKNNIFRESANWSLKDFYLGISEDFNNLQYISGLDEKLIINERYRTPKGMIEQIEIEDDGSISLSKAILEDFFDANKYSYGGVIACYLAYLKHNDIGKFNSSLEIFKSKRFNLFEPRIFEDMGTNPDEIIKIYEKGLDDVSTKKLIL